MYDPSMGQFKLVVKSSSKVFVHVPNPKLKNVLVGSERSKFVKECVLEDEIGQKIK
jgi:hypothetical protein